MGEIEYVWFYINIISKLNFYIHINKKYIVLFVYLKLFKRLTHIKIIIEYNINNQGGSILEDRVYKENLKKLPKVGEIVKVKGEKEKAKVTAVDILNLNVKVKFGFDSEDEERYETYPVDKIKFTPKQNKNDDKSNEEIVEEDVDITEYEDIIE